MKQYSKMFQTDMLGEGGWHTKCCENDENLLFEGGDGNKNVYIYKSA